MKTLSKLNLNQFNKVEMEARQMNALKGGNYCICVGCLCAGGLDAMYNSDNWSGLVEEMHQFYIT